jgi:GT2 family glycosyltransferase/SAM-dependent methyltransferase
MARPDTDRTLGELFTRRTPARTQPRKGERLTPPTGERGGTEHLHRYLVARDLARGLRVLDFACGEGYGTDLLAQTAREVVGIDPDEVSIAQARNAYPAANLRFEAGSDGELPLPDGSIDLVVSFETLEHLPDQDRFLAEIRRVLAPGGRLLVSTPDRDVDAPGPRSPHAVYGLSRAAFGALLHRHFPHVVLLGQRPVPGSSLVPTEPRDGNGSRAAPVRVFERRDEYTFEASSGPDRAPHWVAIAGDAPVTDAAVSLYFEADRLDVSTAPADEPAASPGTEHVGRDGIGHEAETRVAALRRDLAARDLALRDRELRVTELTTELERARTMLDRERDRLALLDARTATWERRASELAGALRVHGLNLNIGVAGRSTRSPAHPGPEDPTAGAERLRAWLDAEGRAGHGDVLVARLEAFGFTSEAAVERCADVATAEDLARWRAALEAHRRPEGTEAPAPLVSVIVPTYGKARLTACATLSLLEGRGETPFEVLVADDHSPDATPELFAGLEDAGVRLVRQPVNAGFVRNCNLAAREARGELVLLLNNDTAAAPGMLDDLVATWRGTGAGAVGARLINLDGTLQEAGGMIWRDGSGWNLGRNLDPLDPRFAFTRPVDYVSGAALMVERGLWERLGGFDDAYQPAYYEDTDLCFRVRALGRDVVVSSTAAVVHLEGVSHGRDEQAGIKAHQVRNRATFEARWRDTIAAHTVPDERPEEHFCTRHLRPTVLFVDHLTPTPDQDSGSVDAVHHMQMLRELGWHVAFWSWFAPLHSGAYDHPRYTRSLQAMGVECLYGPWIELEPWLRRRGNELQLCVVNRVTVAREALPLLKRAAPHARVLFVTCDLHFLREERAAALSGDREAMRSAADTRRDELACMRDADLTTVCSTEELDVMARTAPELEVVRLPLPRRFPDSVPGLGGRRYVAFLGGFRHDPNLDAMEWFLDAIWPRIRAEAPDAEFLLAGAHMPDVLRARRGEGVRVLGHVEDLGDFFRYVRVMVTPLRYGAGLKGKVLTSLGYGVPIVATPVAVEGLGFDPERCAVLADEPESFAAGVLALLRDDRLWERLARDGRSAVREHFGYEVVRGHLGELLQRMGLAAGVPPGTASIAASGARAAAAVPSAPKASTLPVEVSRTIEERLEASLRELQSALEERDARDARAQAHLEATLDDYRRRVRRAFKRPLTNLRRSIVWRVLRFLARQRWLFSARRIRKLEKSARKRELFS